MRRDFLMGNVTMERCAEYQQMAHASFEKKTAVYGFHPMAISAAWERAEEWAESRSSDLW